MPVRILIAVLAICVASGGAGAQISPPAAGQAPTSIDPAATAPRPGQRPELSSKDRAAILGAVRDDKNRTKTAAVKFPTEVGAEVPPALELYSLPDDALIQVPIAKMFKFVMVDGKIILVDPTTMRVVEVIDR